MTVDPGHEIKIQKKYYIILSSMRLEGMVQDQHVNDVNGIY